VKIDIQHEEVKKGLVFKKTKYQVTMQVIYTEEEKQIMKKNKLSRLSLVDGENWWTTNGKTPPGMHDHGIYAGHFTDEKPIKVVLDTPSDAKALESELVGGLRKLKDEIDYLGQGNKSTSLEL